MSIESGITIVGDGPTGATVVTIDKRGILDSANRMVHAPKSIDWPLLAGSLASYMWTCEEGIWTVASVRAKVSVTGGASATVDVMVCSGILAPGSGTSQLSAVLDVQETAPFRAAGTLIAAPTQIFPGDSVSVVPGGTLTGLVGLLTVVVKRIA